MHSNLFNLTRLTKFTKIATMGSPQQTPLAAFTPQFEVHTMTVQALSPPNPMQSLRERLIKEGTIVPESSAKELIDKVREKINHLIIVSNSLTDEIRRSCIECTLSVIKGHFRSLDSEYESGNAEKKPSHFWVISFSLLINKINKNICSLFSKSILKSKNLVAIRHGFYSPLKENMKNTP